LGPGLGEVSQGGLKVLHFDVSHKKSATPNQKFFLHCKLQDFPSLSSVWTALYQLRHQSLGQSTLRSW